jgi:uncharacterized phiE125 gp8 family phage protein
MRVLVITPPEPVVSLEEAKAHLRVLANDEDALITTYVAAATGHIDGPDGWLGRAIGAQTLEARGHVFRDAMVLPYPPIIEIVSVKHLDAAGAEVTLLASEYEVRGSLIGSAFGRRWPAVGVHDEAIRIRYRAGYEAVPPAIKAAILLMTEDLYANRGTVAAGQSVKVDMSTTVENLLSPFQVWR